jgi:hypothetical protein
MKTTGRVVRRVLTDTPLARLHERTLARSGSRAHKPIDFDQFDRTRYPDAALALAFEAQRALALGEYTAVDLFSGLVRQLAQHGAPFDVIGAAARIPSDEIRHADLVFRMAALLAGEPVEVRFDPASLQARWSRPVSLEDLDIAMTEVSAVGETLACALIGACRARATDPVAHAVFASILADEVHHARLGWYYLAWRAPRWTRAERQHLADYAGGLVVDIEARFRRGRDAPAAAREGARALGVLETRGQRKAVRAVMDDEIVPALDALGLGASHAWKLRRRADA